MSNVQGIESLLKKLNTLSGNVDSVLGKSMARQTKFVQGAAKMLAPVDTGMLRQTISREVKAEKGKVTGIVACWSEYGAYVEFGTGRVGEESNPESASKLGITYKQDGWVYTPDGGENFYYTEGQPAQPFMYPALKDNEKTIIKNIQRDIKKAIDEVAKK